MVGRSSFRSSFRSSRSNAADAVTEHPTLLTGKTHPNNYDEIKNLWEDLTLSLNSCGDGPVRRAVEWKKVFIEWKSATRKKARENKQLNKLEDTLMHLTGIGAVAGITPSELGLNNNEMTENEKELDKEEWEDIPNDNQDEDIIIEVVGNPADNSTTKKRSRKTTGDILTDAYQKASSDQKSGLEQIANAIQSVALAINRYCDIVEGVGVDRLPPVS